jgi:2-oxoglutarate ferredoxin oxidoreductase subunit gamma
MKMVSHSKTDKSGAAHTDSELIDRFEIRFSGSGGQGLILAGVMLAEAVATVDGKNCVQTQSYGPEARGGASRADVVISSGEIYYPKPMQLDLLLALSQEACDNYYHDLKEDGLLIVDSHLVTQVPTTRWVGIPFSQLARHTIGNTMVANVISLGAICAISGIVSEAGLTEVVKRRAPRGTEEKNIAALQLGLAEGKKAKERMRL